MLRLAVNIINDCCSSIQAIVQLSCGPQVPSWGVCLNPPNPPAYRPGNINHASQQTPVVLLWNYNYVLYLIREKTLD